LDEICWHDVHAHPGGAYLEHEKAKAELKSLIPEYAYQALRRGIRAKRSKSGAINFDLVKVEEESHAIQRDHRRDCGCSSQTRLAELTNLEKSLVATIEIEGRGQGKERSFPFRYVPLSNGLEFVPQNLGPSDCHRAHDGPRPRGGDQTMVNRSRNRTVDAKTRRGLRLASVLWRLCRAMRATPSVSASASESLRLHRAGTCRTSEAARLAPTAELTV
jgi:hypothetical protein